MEIKLMLKRNRSVRKISYLFVALFIATSGYTQTTDDFFKQASLKITENQDYKGAIDDYTKIIELSPKSSRAYASRGYAKIKLEDYKGAIDDFYAAIFVDPDNSDSYLACLLYTSPSPRDRTRS